MSRKEIPNPRCWLWGHEYYKWIVESGPNEKDYIWHRMCLKCGQLQVGRGCEHSSIEGGHHWSGWKTYRNPTKKEHETWLKKALSIKTKEKREKRRRKTWRDLI